MNERPSLFDYADIPDFVRAALAWRRANEAGFSLRREATSAGLSHSLVSRIASGERQLTRDRVDAVARVLALSGAERAALDRWVAGARKPSATKTPTLVRKDHVGRTRRPQNHLLQDWLNVYVKDASKLENFRPEPEHLSRLLGDLAPPPRIERSLKFLQREGFLRRTVDGKLVVDEPLVTSSDGIPHAKIRAFHKRALAIAQRNIDLLPVGRRREWAMVMHLNDDSLDELRELLKEFYERLLQFAEAHPDDKKNLYQVLLNLTPISHATETTP